MHVRSVLVAAAAGALAASADSAAPEPAPAAAADTPAARAADTTAARAADTPAARAANTPAARAANAPGRPPPADADAEGSGAVDAPDWAPTVGVRAAPARAHLGEPIEIVVTAVHRGDVQVRLAPGASDAVELLDRSERATDLGDGRVRTEFVLRVAAWDPDAAEVPAMEVAAVGPGGALWSGRTDPVPIEVVRVTAGVDEPPLQPDAPPVEVLVPDRRAIAVAAGLAAAALIALAVVRARRRRARRPAAARAPDPPDVAALAALAELRRSERMEAGDFDAVCLRLSAIVREYFGARWAFDALERTSEEIHAQLAERVSAGLLARIDALLAGCDRVKFARYPIDFVAARDLCDQAAAVVRATRPAPAAAPDRVPEAA